MNPTAVIGPDGKPVMDFDSNSRKRGYIRKPEEFELMLAYVDYILRDTGRAILGGDISASPYRLKAKKEQTAQTIPTKEKALQKANLIDELLPSES